MFTYVSKGSTTADEREEAGKNCLVPAVRNGHGALLICLCFFFFLDSAKIKYVAICHADGTCSKRPSCLRHSLFPYFFPLPVHLFWCGVGLEKYFSPGPKPTHFPCVVSSLAIPLSIPMATIFL